MIRRATPCCEKLAIQSGKQPRLNLRLISQLSAAGGPQEKGLLRQIQRVALMPRQAKSEAVQHQVMGLNNLVKVQARHACESTTSALYSSLFSRCKTVEAGNFGIKSPYLSLTSKIRNR